MGRRDAQLNVRATHNIKRHVAYSCCDLFIYSVRVFGFGRSDKLCYLQYMRQGTRERAKVVITFDDINKPLYSANNLSTLQQLSQKSAWLQEYLKIEASVCKFSPNKHPPRTVIIVQYVVYLLERHIKSQQCTEVVFIIEDSQQTYQFVAEVGLLSSIKEFLQLLSLVAHQPLPNLVRSQYEDFMRRHATVHVKGQQFSSVLVVVCGSSVQKKIIQILQEHSQCQKVVVSHPHLTPSHALYPSHPQAYNPQPNLTESTESLEDQQEELTLDNEASSKLLLLPVEKSGIKKVKVVSPFAKKSYASPVKLTKEQTDEEQPSEDEDYECL